MPPPKYAEALQILGVQASDDQDTVRNAYKALALKFHPDKCTELTNVEATAKFQSIGAAYKVRLRCASVAPTVGLLREHSVVHSVVFDAGGASATRWWPAV
jgi:hypothetical protein